MLRAATETLRTLIHLKVLVAALWVVGAGPASAALTFSNSYRSPRNPERRGDIHGYVVVSGENRASRRKARGPRGKARDSALGRFAAASVEHEARLARIRAHSAKRRDALDVPVPQRRTRNGGVAIRKPGGKFPEGHAGDGGVVAAHGTHAPPSRWRRKIEIHDRNGTEKRWRIVAVFGGVVDNAAKRAQTPDKRRDFGRLHFVARKNANLQSSGLRHAQDSTHRHVGTWRVGPFKAKDAFFRL